MSDLDDKAKELLKSLKSSALETNLLSSDRWKSSRLWVAIGGLVTIIILYRMGIADKLIDYTFLMAAGFMILKSITDVMVSWGNTRIECKRLDVYSAIEVERVKQGREADSTPDFAENSATKKED